MVWAQLFRDTDRCESLQYLMTPLSFKKMEPPLFFIKGFFWNNNGVILHWKKRKTSYLWSAVHIQTLMTVSVSLATLYWNTFFGLCYKCRSIYRYHMTPSWFQKKETPSCEENIKESVSWTKMEWYHTRKLARRFIWWILYRYRILGLQTCYLRLFSTIVHPVCFTYVETFSSIIWLHLVFKKARSRFLYEKRSLLFLKSHCFIRLRKQVLVQYRCFFLD